ncbi:potassium channel subfamily K member 1-like [Hippoglossus hippoglossus]|uniref:potassium channel subfamily K member 1-like n=1 Tax=Hippoglossus hippoglossus TaxID=8267 RepID=UPI00148C7EFC|nr:potassium channel subfamily K member 1-like [Hippoglossus hippoglossus]XP_035001052.1 potassium channel subfamily K member 1 [Hippoglossus stenolepis]
MPRCCAGGCWASFVDRHRSALNFALLVAGYIFYLIVGAGIFSTIELPYELELREQLQEARQDFLRNNTCVSDARLEELLVRALEATNYGVSVLGNDSDRNWDFVSSFFFTSTVLTTTGYGHNVPLSDEGKAFCIFYSIFGIPFTLFFLSAVVQRIMVVVTQRPVAYFHRRWAMSKSKFALIHATCLTILMTLLFLIIPAWIFISLEKDWNFLESLYFCFISLTTIGLGDYVPGETHSKEANPHPQLYRLTITVYLLLGLVCALVVLETCCELPQMRRLRQRFYQESVRELDSETTNIIEREHKIDQLRDVTDHVTDTLPVISSVSEQAASLRQLSKSAPYIPVSSDNRKLR